MRTVNTVPELLRTQASPIPEQPFVHWRGRLGQLRGVRRPN